MATQGMILSRRKHLKIADADTDQDLLHRPRRGGRPRHTTFPVEHFCGTWQPFIAAE
jgi:hypothetical protein